MGIYDFYVGNCPNCYTKFESQTKDYITVDDIFMNLRPIFQRFGVNSILPIDPISNCIYIRDCSTCNRSIYVNIDSRTIISFSNIEK